MVVHRPEKTVASFVPNCPFCPGNESQTPPEVMRVPGSNGPDWLVRPIPNPRPQMVGFGDITSVELNDLAFVVKIMLGKLYHARNNLDFNFTIRTVPAELIGVKYFHWYLNIIPRLTRVAGFEPGSGMFINTVLAESAAEFLRNLKLEKAVGQPA